MIHYRELRKIQSKDPPAESFPLTIHCTFPIIVVTLSDIYIRCILVHSHRLADLHKNITQANTLGSVGNDAQAVPQNLNLVKELGVSLLITSWEDEDKVSHVLYCLLWCVPKRFSEMLDRQYLKGLQVKSRGVWNDLQVVARVCVVKCRKLRFNLIQLQAMGTSFLTILFF